jgi:precorrin-6B methylase 2
MIALNDQQLNDFQSALDWRTGLKLPDGRVLGVAGKRGRIPEATDTRVRAVAERCQPAGKTILEFGCCEGTHTVQLAGLCKEVVALEVRPKNIACALVRLFVHEVRNVRLLLKDVREVDGGFGRFDILFHVGVLYHLADPVEHLARIAPLGDQLLLDTHYADDSSRYERSDIRHGGKSYAASAHRDGAWDDAFSGVEPTARWLRRDALLELLKDVGFGSLDVLDDRVERNGPRLTLLASR